MPSNRSARRHQRWPHSIATRIQLSRRICQLNVDLMALSAPHGPKGVEGIAHPIQPLIALRPCVCRRVPQCGEDQHGNWREVAENATWRCATSWSRNRSGPSHDDCPTAPVRAARVARKSAELARCPGHVSGVPATEKRAWSRSLDGSVILRRDQTRASDMRAGAWILLGPSVCSCACACRATTRLAHHSRKQPLCGADARPRRRNNDCEHTRVGRRASCSEKPLQAAERDTRFGFTHESRLMPCFIPTSRVLGAPTEALRLVVFAKSRNGRVLPMRSGDLVSRDAERAFTSIVPRGAAPPPRCRAFEQSVAVFEWEVVREP